MNGIIGAASSGVTELEPSDACAATADPISRTINPPVTSRLFCLLPDAMDCLYAPGVPTLVTR